MEQFLFWLIVLGGILEIVVLVIVYGGWSRVKAKLPEKLVKPGCPECGSKNWKIENIACGAYVPQAYCKDCGHSGNVEIGSKCDKKEWGGLF